MLARCGARHRPERRRHACAHPGGTRATSDQRSSEHAISRDLRSAEIEDCGHIRLALRVVLRVKDAREAIGAARVVLVRPVPRLAVGADAAALAVACIRAHWNWHTATVVLGVDGVGLARETGNAASGA